MRRTIRDIFFTHQAQTTAQPIGLEVKKARGSYIIDKDNKNIEVISLKSNPDLYGKFDSNEYEVRQKNNRYFAVTKSQSGSHECWRVLSKKQGEELK